MYSKCWNNRCCIWSIVAMRPDLGHRLVQFALQFKVRPRLRQGGPFFKIRRRGFVILSFKSISKYKFVKIYIYIYKVVPKKKKNPPQNKKHPSQSVLFKGKLPFDVTSSKFFIFSYYIFYYNFFIN